MAEKLNFQEMVEFSVKKAKEKMKENIHTKLETAIDENRLTLDPKMIGIYFNGMHRQFLVFSSIFFFILIINSMYMLALYFDVAYSAHN